MTTTTVSDAVILPQSQGTGLSGENATIDAAINGVLNRYVGGEYVSSTYSTGLAFQNHSSSNDTVEVGPGIVFVQDNSTSTSGERGSGGNPQAESSTTSGYDTELPEGHTYAVLLPTATQISVTDSTLNEVYVDIDDVTANNSVNLEHDGSSNASPGNTSLKIGETNPDDANADTRANDDASPTYNSLTVNGTTTTDVLNADKTSINNVIGFLQKIDNTQDFDNGALTKVSWQDETREQSGVVDIDSTTNEIEVLEDGAYIVTSAIHIDGDSISWSTGDTVELSIFKNGSRIYRVIYPYVKDDVNQTVNISHLTNLNKNDVLDVRLEQNSGNNGANLIGGATLNYFHVGRLG